MPVSTNATADIHNESNANGPRLLASTEYTEPDKSHTLHCARPTSHRPRARPRAPRATRRAATEGASSTLPSARFGAAVRFAGRCSPGVASQSASKAAPLAAQAVPAQAPVSAWTPRAQLPFDRAREFAPQSQLPSIQARVRSLRTRGSVIHFKSKARAVTYNGGLVVSFCFRLRPIILPAHHAHESPLRGIHTRRNSVTSRHPLMQTAFARRRGRVTVE